MGRATKRCPVRKSTRRHSFAEDMGCAICFRGFYLKNRGAALFVHKRVLKKMKEVRRFYKEVVEAVCEELELDPVAAFSTNRERCVDARGLIVCLLAKRIPDGLISALTGLTRQAVNRLKNIYPERIEHSFYLLMAFRNARNKIATHSQ